MSVDLGGLKTWSFGVSAIAYAVFAVYLGTRLPKPEHGRRTAWVFLQAVVVTSVWAGAGMLGSISELYVFELIERLADILRYGLWYAFVLIVLRPQALRRGLRVGSLMEAVAGTAVILGIVLLGLAHGLIPGPELPPRARAFTSMALSVLGLFLVEQLFRNIQEDSRWNAKPLCIGLGGAFLFDFYLYSAAALFNTNDPDAAKVQGVAHAMMVPLLLLATARRADWISKLRVSRTVAFHSATLLATGVYLLFISAIGYYVRFFGGEWGSALQVALIFSGLTVLAVIVVSGTMRAKLKVLLGKHFFNYRYDYREEWLSFTRTLSSQESPQEMGKHVIRGLADMVESPAGILWLKRTLNSEFAVTAAWNMPAVADCEAFDSPFVGFLRDSGWVINLEEYRDAPHLYAGMVLPNWLVPISQAWLIVPLRVGDDLMGFVLLARARIRLEVNWEVTDLLKTAGRQAATFMAQMQATEALLEARKFEAFNRMSAFVVHDLKNIVTQLSLMLKNAQRLQNNPEFQQDMLMTVQNSLDRMRQMMLQLREGATPAGQPTGVDLTALARRAEVSAGERGWALEVQLRERLAARGHEERVERILGHLLQNAMEATAPGGRVWMVVERFGSQARIQVGDTGHGMSADFVRDQLFKPFQSTKAGGMGIGAYESFQYVRELGGSISVESNVGEGTVVTLLLPLLETRVESDLHILESS